MPTGRMPSESGLSIVVQGVTKTYGSVRALADIELEVRNGEFLEYVEAGGTAPRYWRRRDGWEERRFDRWIPLAKEEPVRHVS